MIIEVTQEAKAILLDGKAIISNPEDWGKHAHGYDATGQSVEPISPKACRWCAYGTLNKARYDGGYSIKALNLARLELANIIQPLVDKSSISFGFCFGIITSHNDAERTTHAEIMEVFDEAIENCE